MKRPWWLCTVAVACALFTAGCAPRGATAVVLSVDSNLGSALTGVVVDLSRGAEQRRFHEVTYDLRTGTFRLPGTLTIGPGADKSSTLNVEVTALYADARQNFSQRATVSFVSERTLLLEMYLARECEDPQVRATCASMGKTCGRGGVCEDVVRTTLPDAPPGMEGPETVEPDAAEPDVAVVSNDVNDVIVVANDATNDASMDAPVPDATRPDVTVGVDASMDAPVPRDVGAEIVTARDALSESAVDACVPRCSGRACGPDGCGGVCGTCFAGTRCEEASGACRGAPGSVAAGAKHSCALRADGSVRCWGKGDRGQLGDGAARDQLMAVAVSGISDALSVTAGEEHSCALLADGTVRCWGRNDRGQLGDGTTMQRNAPVAVAGLADVVSIAAGLDHTCARTRDNRAYCWGDNSDGQLGDAAMMMPMMQPRPVAVAELSDVRTIAAGASHTCAITADTQLWCWGRNMEGQLGSTGGAARAPRVVPGLTGVVSVAAGDKHTCAALGDGSARCWGSNMEGQLGDDSTMNRSAPAAVFDLRNALGVAAGAKHSCARRSDGTASCWGADMENQLGNGSGRDRSTRPSAVLGLARVTELVSSESHTCARVATGAVYCWGLNTEGQLGDVSRGMRDAPVMVLGL